MAKDRIGEKFPLRHQLFRLVQKHSLRGVLYSVTVFGQGQCLVSGENIIDEKEGECITLNEKEWGI